MYPLDLLKTWVNQRWDIPEKEEIIERKRFTKIWEDIQGPRRAELSLGRKKKTTTLNQKKIESKIKCDKERAIELIITTMAITL